MYIEIKAIKNIDVCKNDKEENCIDIVIGRDALITLTRHQAQELYDNLELMLYGKRNNCCCCD